MIGRSQKLVDLPAWMVEAAGQMELHDVVMNMHKQHAQGCGHTRISPGTNIRHCGISYRALERERFILLLLTLDHQLEKLDFI